MREIKFRAWNTKSGRFAKDGELFLVIDSENYNLYSVDFDNFRLENDNYILMQSTGLKDKNGVEIFEGDIVRWKDLESFDDFPIDEVFKVEYSDEFMKWTACYKSDLQDDLYDFTDNRDLEVIGNIFEDKERKND